MIELRLREPKDVIIDGKTLEQILIDHKHWLDEDWDECDENRAVLRGVDLRGVDLRGVVLTQAIFNNVNLLGSDLTGADLSLADFRNVNFNDTDLTNAKLCSIRTFNVSFIGADLTKANLNGARLSDANLSRAILCDADLSCANLAFANLAFANLCNSILPNTILCGANLCDANLYNVSLNGKTYLDKANLIDANFNYELDERVGRILTESIIGYKKCSDGIIVTLEIPRGAIVFSINGKKCRTNKVKVIDIDGANRAFAEYNGMSYYVGDEITVYNFDCEYNVECGTGIHFFKTREEAEKYWS